MAECGKKIKRGPRKGQVCGRACWQDTDKCWGHQPKEIKASKGFGGSQPNSGRPRVETPIDAARELVRQNIDVLIRPHFKVLGYDIEVTYDRGKDVAPSLKLTELAEGGARMYGESKDGEIVASTFEDLGAMINAAEKLIDRLWGKPRQAVEIGGKDGGPIEMVSVERPEGEKGKLLKLVSGAGNG